MSFVDTTSGYERVLPLENNFPVKIIANEDRKEELMPHWHEHTELLYFTKGECEAVLDGKSFSVKEGDLLVVNSCEVHSFSVKRNVDFLCLLIYPDFFSDIAFSGVLLKSVVRGDAHVGEIFEKIKGIRLSEGGTGSLILKSLVYELFARLFDLYRAPVASDREELLRKADLKRLRAVTEYVGENYMNKISTAEISRAVYLSEGYFCRFFKRMTGRSFSSYLTGVRIQKAKAQLWGTDMSVSEIAESVGFEDGNYFSRVFKKQEGVSPLEYRKGLSHLGVTDKKQGVL